MSIKFFGQFLLERGVLNRDQLLEAISYQENHNLRFGQYAQRKGYLTEADVERLNEEQKTADMLIGELAVKLGMLETYQVEEILTMQKNDHVQIGRVLVMKGFLDDAGLQRELDAFKEDQRPYATDKIVVPPEIKNAELVADIVDITLKMMQRIAGIEAKADDGTLINSDPDEKYSAVSITFSGGLNCDFVIMADEDASRAMAASILGEDASAEDREMIVDGVKEFANVVCGNILARMAQRGKSVEITIPHIMEYKGGYGLTGDGNTLVYQVPTTAGNSSLVLVVY